MALTRGGKAKTRGEPERRCIATGQSGPTVGMVRFVVGPENVITADVLGKLPGRGIWVTARRDALEKALAKGLFARAAKAQVTVPADLVAAVDRMLAARVVDLIALSRKAGGAVAGYEKVKAWLENGRAALLLQAADGSERGKGKLRPPSGKASLVNVLTGDELGLAFGRENVIHGALASGGLTARVVEDAARLQGLRETVGNAPAGKDKRTE